MNEWIPTYRVELTEGTYQAVRDYSLKLQYERPVPQGAWHGFPIPRQHEKTFVPNSFPIRFFPYMEPANPEQAGELDPDEYPHRGDHFGAPKEYLTAEKWYPDGKWTWPRFIEVVAEIHRTNWEKQKPFMQAVEACSWEDTWITQATYWRTSLYKEDVLENNTLTNSRTLGTSYFPVEIEPVIRNMSPADAPNSVMAVTICQGSMYLRQKPAAVTAKEDIFTQVAYNDSEPELTVMPTEASPHMSQESAYMSLVAAKLEQIKNHYVAQINAVPDGVVTDIRITPPSVSIGGGGLQFFIQPTFSDLDWANYYGGSGAAAKAVYNSALAGYQLRGVAGSIEIDFYASGVSDTIYDGAYILMPTHPDVENYGNIPDWTRPIAYWRKDWPGEVPPADYAWQFWPDKMPIPWVASEQGNSLPLFNWKSASELSLDEYVAEPDARFNGRRFLCKQGTASVTRSWFTYLRHDIAAAPDYTGEYNEGNLIQTGWVNAYTNEFIEGTPIECGQEIVFLADGWLTEELVDKDWPGYPWPDITVTLPPSQFFLQDGSQAPLYPDFTGAYVYDTHLKKWGKMVQDYKIVLDYQAVNTYLKGEQNYGKFGLFGGVMTDDGKMRLFDDKPSNSWITYGKIGYYRQGMTTIEEIRVHHRTTSYGKIKSQTSIEGKLLSPELEQSSEQSGTFWQLTGGYSGKWHNIRIEGKYDISFIEFRGIRQGKR